MSVLEARSDENSRALWRYEQDHEAFAKAIDCSALGMGVATDRATRCVSTTR